MIFSPSAPAVPKWRDALARTYRADEEEIVAKLQEAATLSAEASARVHERARALVQSVRDNRAASGGIDAFMNEYDLSTQEGLTLMCLAEALLRVPDPETADRLIRDKLTGTDWEKHLGHSRSIFVNASTIGLMLTGRVLGPADVPEDAPGGVMRRLVSRMGEPVIRQALRQAMRIMGRQFVLGRTIGEAMERAKEQERKGYRYSYDMLGEAARTEKDARVYYDAYEQAIHAIGAAANGRGVIEGPGISVKLSALHPRYEPGKREKMLDILVTRTLKLAQLAKSYDIGFCVDAEEAERLELSLEIYERVYSDPSLDGWTGFGLALQAYQKRAWDVIDVLADMGKRVGRRMNVRLVKGAYWDTEVKLAQELGMSDYPVFTRKVNSDVSYLACARKLFDYGDLFYPQFATHNAHTAAAVAEMAGGQPFEFQRLHGMGEEMYDELVPADKGGFPCRIYAPVGGHAELLSYLVRRLLENGANTSFVNRLVDDRTPIDDIIEDPVKRLEGLPRKRHPHIPVPRDIYGASRINSKGLDLSDSLVLEPVAAEMQRFAAVERAAGPIIGGEVRAGNGTPVRDPANTQRVFGTVAEASEADVEEAVTRAEAAFPAWNDTAPEVRAQAFEKVAVLMEERMTELMAICTREAGKTLNDGVAEVREAVDFLRYYANRVREEFGRDLPFPDASGKAAQVRLRGRGVFLCISPWNFPLAIFTGQVTAALGAGNAVIAKPAEQTPVIAFEAVKLFHEAGIPVDALQLLPGQGETVGAKLVADPRVKGVAFTGSVEVAHIINRQLAARDGGPVPLIAETGGLNAMIVDSSALPEQVVRDVLISAFGSAGQRCSALRVLYVQEDVADNMIDMLKGAMAELKVGDPAYLSTDVGPVIDDEARSMLVAHAGRMGRRAKTIHVCALPPETEGGTFFAPRAYEIGSIHELEKEVFGPVLHVVRYKATELDDVLGAIRETGYGLTMGVHSRIDSQARAIQRKSRIGNTYINRNMIGAVVGVQPFGGEGLSGTGPKAGGPHYVPRFARIEVAVQDAWPDGVRSLAQEAGKLLPADLPPAPPSVGTEALGRALDEAHAAYLRWSRRPAEERAALVEAMADRIAADKALLTAVLGRDAGKAPDRAAGEVKAAESYLRDLAAKVRAELAAPVKLPGPTGEHNELQFHGRGVAACVTGRAASFAAAVAQIGAAVGAGNAVVALTDPSMAAALDRLSLALETASAPYGVMGLVFGDGSLAKAAARDGRATFMACAGAAEEATALAQELAQREGPIAHFVHEPYGPHFLDRFLNERTLSIDMTAAGGNASLLTLNEDAPSAA